MSQLQFHSSVSSPPRRNVTYTYTCTGRSSLRVETSGTKKKKKKRDTLVDGSARKCENEITNFAKYMKAFLLQIHGRREKANNDVSMQVSQMTDTIGAKFPK